MSHVPWSFWIKLQLPPVVISTPLKIMLFVMVDGWNLLVGSLMKSFT